jgi:hypothetical protein
MSTFFILPTLNFGNCIASNDKIPFNLNELSGSIDVSSPVNGSTSYSSNIVVNVGLHIGGREETPGIHYVPYQNISCVYSLDGSEWQRMSLLSVNPAEPFSSGGSPLYYSNTWLNCTVLIQNITEGTHSLRVDIKPNTIYTMSIHGQGKPIIQFYVVNQAPLTDELDKFPILTLFIIITIIIGSFAYKKKGVSESSHN